MYDDAQLIKNLSENLDRLRGERGLSIYKLAEQTGLSFSEVRNILDCKIKKLNTANVVRLANFFHISAADLLGVEELPSELGIVDLHSAFKPSYFEKIAGNFLYDNEIHLENINRVLMKPLAEAVHGVTEGHRIATGFYYETYDPNMGKSFDPETAKKESHEFFLRVELDEIFAKYLDDDEVCGQEEDILQDIKKLREKLPKKTAAKKDACTPQNESEQTQKFNEFCKNRGINLKRNKSEPDPRAVGNTVHALRKFYGIGRKELGELTRLGEDLIYRIEKGINRKIDYSQLVVIARELNCTADFLLGSSIDPTADSDGKSVIYQSDGAIYRDVRLGHDLAYAASRMDEASKNLIVQILKHFQSLSYYMHAHERDFRGELTNSEIFFREQSLLKEMYPKYGGQPYTTRTREREDD